MNDLTQPEMQAAIDVEGKGKWSDWERGKSHPSYEDLKKISDYFRLKADELLYHDLSIVHPNKNEVESKTGADVHLNVHPSVHLKAENEQFPLNEKAGTLINKIEETSPKYELLMPKVVTVDSKGHDNMVMVPVKARAGYLNGYGDQEFVGSLPSFRLPGYTNGTFRMFEVEGFSMYNTLHDKDLIATEFVENIDQVRDGRIYVIVTQQYGVVIKRVLNRIKTDNKLVLKSDAIKDRHLHPPIIISPDDVLEIWYVKGKLTRQLPGPEDIFARMDAIEAELAILQHNRLKTEP